MTPHSDPSSDKNQEKEKENDEQQPHDYERGEFYEEFVEELIEGEEEKGSQFMKTKRIFDSWMTTTNPGTLIRPNLQINTDISIPPP